MGADYKRIIIVDDSDVYRAGLRAMIDGSGKLKVVAEAECGDKAIEAVRNVPADLILLDLSLPRRSGLEVLKQIREISDVPVLILSIYESEEIIRSAVACGAQGYCIKDSSRNELLKAIQDAAEGSFYVCHPPEGSLN